MLRSKKALSPVVASIILIAVVVTVSMVAAWMGTLPFTFMNEKPPADIKVVPIFLEPNTINVTITNKGPSVIYPKNLLIDNITVWPVVVISNLSVGSSKTSLIDYNWTYHTVYTFTLVWWNSKDGSADLSKESNFSVRFTSPPKIQKGSLAIGIPLIKEFVHTNNPYIAFTFIPNVEYLEVTYGQTHLKGQNLTFLNFPVPLPCSFTINTTDLEVGQKLYFTVTYYECYQHNFFEVLGKRDFMIIVDKTIIILKGGSS